MLDAYVPGKHGGTGETFSWELAEEREASHVPLVLSGGLTPENVADGDRRGAAVRASTRRAAPRRRRAARTRRRCTAFIRAVGAGVHAVGGVTDAGRAPLRPLRRPLRPRDADPGARRARARVARGARRRGLQGRARGAAARLRGPPDAALPRRAALGGGRPARSSSSARTCSTPGAHKINNALGQVLLAKRMGKTRIIAETGAGQHGVGDGHRVRAARRSSASSTWAPRTSAASARTSSG